MTKAWANQLFSHASQTKHSMIFSTSIFVGICNWHSRLTHRTWLSGTHMMSPNSAPWLERCHVNHRASKVWLDSQKTPLLTPKKAIPVEGELMMHCVVANKSVPNMCSTSSAIVHLGDAHGVCILNPNMAAKTCLIHGPFPLPTDGTDGNCDGTKWVLIPLPEQCPPCKMITFKKWLRMMALMPTMPCHAPEAPTCKMTG